MLTRAWAMTLAVCLSSASERYVNFIAYFSRSLHTASGCRSPEIEMMKRQVI